MADARAQRWRRLFARTRDGIKPGLETTRELMERLGNPQQRFLSVHVAGTNGKGSVCALIEQGLRDMGLRSGLFTSPHLVRLNERIQIGGVPVADDVLDALLDQIEAVEGTLDRPPTFFETITALGFLAFAEAKVQVAVIETGMGGRLDSSNVVMPLVSVITPIDFDHMRFLGNTLSAIAFEKAGILKPGRPAVFGPQADEARETLLRVAAERGVSVVECREAASVSGRKQDLDGQRLKLQTHQADYGLVRLPLLGRFQIDALATAVLALEQVCEALGQEPDPKVLRAAVAKTRWPARCEVISKEPPILLDVAHNPGGAKALAESLVELFGGKARGAFVVGVMADKDVRALLLALAPRVGLCLCVNIDNERAMPAADLAALAKSLGIRAEAATLDAARARLPELAREYGFGCVAGSVYLAGAWMAGETDAGERF